MRVRDLGEFGLIQRLQARVAARSRHSTARTDEASRSRDRPLTRPRLELAIGDDAAVWRPADGARQVITTDALVEDVHFRLTTSGWRDLGWKALAVNVSDLAGMGATPRYALVTLGLPAETRVADLLDLYDGMLDLAVEHDLGIIGGDVVSSPQLLLNVTVIGDTLRDVLRRDAGRVGDLVAVTGRLGASAGGFRLLEAGRQAEASTAALLQAHLRPQPRVGEGVALVRAGVRCGMDLSDGLLGDLTHVCERSELGAVLDAAAVPVHPALMEQFGDDALGLAIGGGEDYELLCAGSAEALERAAAALAWLDTPLTIVGRLVERPADGPLVQVLDADGRPLAPERPSWDHFRGG